MATVHAVGLVAHLVQISANKVSLRRSQVECSVLVTIASLRSQLIHGRMQCILAASWESSSAGI